MGRGCIPECNGQGGCPTQAGVYPAGGLPRQVSVKEVSAGGCLPGGVHPPDSAADTSQDPEADTPPPQDDH